MKRMKHIIKTILFILCVGAVFTTANAESEYEWIMNPTEIHVGFDGEAKIAKDGSISETWKKGYHFTGLTMHKKMVPIYMCETGMLYIDGYDNMDLYDKNQNKIEIPYMNSGGEWGCIPNVQKGDLFYCKVYAYSEFDPDHEAVIHMRIIPEQGKQICEKTVQYLIGSEKTINKYFSIKKKSITYLRLTPIMDGDGKVIASLQKKQNGKWNTIIRNMEGEDDAHGKWEFDLALTKGQYRFKIKIPKKQSAMFGYYTHPVRKVAYKQKKAIVINKKEKVSEKRRYALFLNDTKAHYFKFKATSKRKYLNVHTDVNTGKLKITVYTKDSTKPIKTLIRKAPYKENPDKEKYDGYIGDSIDVSKCKGTVYVKVEKVNKKSSGAYKLILSNGKCY